MRLLLDLSNDRFVCSTTTIIVNNRFLIKFGQNVNSIEQRFASVVIRVISDVDVEFG